MRVLLFALASSLVVVATGCTDTESTAAPPGADYKVTIRRTSYGIPHVTAEDLGSLAYGVGYAAGQDYGCSFADQMVKIQSRRAATFGPGASDANIDSDFAYLALDIQATAAAELPKQPEEVRDLLAGYAAGYNRWIADTGPDALPAPCTGAAWVQPITAVDLAAYTLDLALRGSAVAFIGYVGKAAPPGSAPPPAGPPAPFALDLAHPGFGSNGWGLGRERTAAGTGIVLANPHFPWEGEIHWHEAHLTVPGKLDVYGASILGSPVIQIGFNQHLAWTHTVAPSQHLTAYALKLVPGDPTSYLVDGEAHTMTSREVSIEVKGAGGELTSQKRTQWKTDYGVMLAGPGLTWSNDTAYALRDANEGDIRLVEQWLRIDQAKSVGELQQALAEVHAVPWVYTIAADDQGDALLSDASRVPNLSKEAVAAFEEAVVSDPLTSLLAQNGATLLDGSTSRDVWLASSEPYADGLVPVAKAPALVRQDYLMNANDAPWASNPAAPLTGYSFLYGSTLGLLYPRSRMNLEMLTEVSANGASGADGKFTLDEVAAAVFNNRQVVAEQLLAQVVARCQGAAPVTIDGAEVDLTAACAALAGWNGRADLDAVGAVLWRELLGQSKFVDVQTAGALYQVPFDPAKPTTTPNTLVAKPANGPDPILVALARAALSLGKAKLAVTATLGDAQYTMKGAKRIAIPGGQDLEGAFNVVSYYGKGNINTSTLPQPQPGASVNGATSLTSDGYLCNKGTSFVMIAEMSKAGPTARALLTTSESRDPSSPHYLDQTEMFAKKELRDVLFSEAQITADPELTTVTLTEAR